MNQGVGGTNIGPQTTLVDETIMAEVRYLIRQAAENSVLTAFVFIGNINPLKEPITIEKFERFFTYLNKTMGFVPDSRSMTASYSYYNTASLLDILQSSE